MPSDSLSTRNKPLFCCSRDMNNYNYLSFAFSCIPYLLASPFRNTFSSILLWNIVVEHKEKHNMFLLMGTYLFDSTVFSHSDS